MKFELMFTPHIWHGLRFTFRWFMIFQIGNVIASLITAYAYGWPLETLIEQFLRSFEVSIGVCAGILLGWLQSSLALRGAIVGSAVKKGCDNLA